MPNEHDLRRKVNELLKLRMANGELWFAKIHGSRYQRAGVPDFIGCLDGLFFSIELKRSEAHEPSPRQQVEMRRIERAGGFAFVCSSVESVEWALGQVRDSR